MTSAVLTFPVLVHGPVRGKSMTGLAGSNSWNERNLETDAQLVERCLHGDDSAWEDLVRAHTRRVYAICLRFTGSDGEAQDITQDVFLRVFQTLRTFRAGEGSFVVWLSRLTRNLLIDNYRRSKMQRASAPIEDQLPMLEARATHGISTEGMLARREANEVLRSALTRLSPELREAVILRDLEELDYREIADVLQIPEGTVKSRLNRGRAELARVLRQRKVLI
ncbi:MAG: sigma-70 family RNA polymerase sigma factor [Bryobacteraceae bacterium]